MTTLNQDGSIEFRFFRPHVSAVHVAGDFNHWEPGALPMHPLGDGWWAAKTTLPPGEYRFRYLVDGHWYTDYAAHGVEMSRNGWNALLVVPDAPSLSQ